MFILETISEDEVEYFDFLKIQNVDTNILNFISKFDKKSDELIEHFQIKKGHKVTANIATQPKRFESLLETLESIDGQFDEIRLYLNNFSYVPDELKKYTTYIGGDLTDNGKFFWSNNEDEYYFTLDDDIIYPSDYVEKTLPLIGDRIVTYHGKILVGKNLGYYGKHKFYSYYKGLSKQKKIDIMGTGVSAFDTNVFKPNLWRTPNFKMTDLLISFEAHLYNIPIISPKKEAGWLTGQLLFNGIYYDMNQHDKKLSNWADMIYDFINSNIDISQMVYKYDDDSIKELSDFIENNKNKITTFINLRTGNGSLIDRISNLTSFKSFYSLDTDIHRIEKCNKLYTDNIVQYKLLNSYLECGVEMRNCFVFLDDFKLLNTLSTNIFNLLRPGSHFICHNFVNNVFPDKKITLRLEDGRDIDFFYYLKK
jgi:hypothetical protein